MTTSPDIKHKYKQVKWAFMQWFDIPSSINPGKVYLRRLRIVQTPLWALYLHFIYEVDAQDPHDHPFNFWTLILRGGYREQVFADPGSLLAIIKLKTWDAVSLHKMSINAAHKIYYLKDKTVTLVFVGRRQKDWGFYTRSGFVPQKEYQYND